MSSILDALNKVAAERAGAQDEVVDPRVAAEEMVGASTLRTLTLTPRVIAAVLGSAALVVAVSVGLSAILLRGQSSPANETITASRDLPKAAPAATPTLPPGTRLEQVAAAAVPASPAVKTESTWREVIQDPALPAPFETAPEISTGRGPAAQANVSPREEAKIPAPVEQQAETAPASPAPSTAPAPEPTTSPLPTFEQIRAERLHARAVESTELPPASMDADAASERIGDAPASEEDLSSAALPELNRVIRERYDLGDLTVNIARPSSATNPRAMAFVNRLKVYENERILTSRARLLKVFSDGIAIEVIGTGERYFAPIGAPR